MTDEWDKHRQCEAWAAWTDDRCKRPATIEVISQGGIRINACWSHWTAYRVYPHWWTRAERRAP